MRILLILALVAVCLSLVDGKKKTKEEKAKVKQKFKTLVANYWRGRAQVCRSDEIFCFRLMACLPRPGVKKATYKRIVILHNCMLSKGKSVAKSHGNANKKEMKDKMKAKLAVLRRIPTTTCRSNQVYCFNMGRCVTTKRKQVRKIISLVKTPKKRSVKVTKRPAAETTKTRVTAAPRPVTHVTAARPVIVIKPAASMFETVKVAATSLFRKPEVKQPAMFPAKPAVATSMFEKPAQKSPERQREIKYVKLATPPPRMVTLPPQSLLEAENKNARMETLLLGESNTGMGEEEMNEFEYEEDGVEEVDVDDLKEKLNDKKKEKTNNGNNANSVVDGNNGNKDSSDAGIEKEKTNNGNNINSVPDGNNGNKELVPEESEEAPPLPDDAVAGALDLTKMGEKPKEKKEKKDDGAIVLENVDGDVDLDSLLEEVMEVEEEKPEKKEKEEKKEKPEKKEKVEKIKEEKVEKQPEPEVKPAKQKRVRRTIKKQCKTSFPGDYAAVVGEDKEGFLASVKSQLANQLKIKEEKIVECTVSEGGSARRRKRATSIEIDFTVQDEVTVDANDESAANSTAALDSLSTSTLKTLTIKGADNVVITVDGGKISISTNMEEEVLMDDYEDTEKGFFMEEPKSGNGAIVGGMIALALLVVGAVIGLGIYCGLKNKKANVTVVDCSKLDLKELEKAAKSDNYAGSERRVSGVAKQSARDVKLDYDPFTPRA